MGCLGVVLGMKLDIFLINFGYFYIFLNRMLCNAYRRNKIGAPGVVIPHNYNEQAAIQRGSPGSSLGE